MQWGPRNSDLDLLLYDQIARADPWLALPHPRLHQRAFVLYPLHDIAPNLTIPGLGSLRDLLAHCPPQHVVQRQSSKPATIILSLHPSCSLFLNLPPSL